MCVVVPSSLFPVASSMLQLPYYICTSGGTGFWVLGSGLWALGSGFSVLGTAADAILQPSSPIGPATFPHVFNASFGGSRQSSGAQFVGCTYFRVFQPGPASTNSQQTDATHTHTHQRTPAHKHTNTSMRGCFLVSFLLKTGNSPQQQKQQSSAANFCNMLFLQLVLDSLQLS